MDIFGDLSMKKLQWLMMAAVTVSALAVVGCDTGDTGSNGTGLHSGWSGAGTSATVHKADDFGERVSGVDAGGAGGGVGNAGAVGGSGGASAVNSNLGAGVAH
jgi:hypothetical protein